jgi:hypothetical protein
MQKVMVQRLPRIIALAILAGVVGCAELHHVQLGDIDSTGGNLRRFEILVSETGVSKEEAADVASALALVGGSKRTADNVDQANGLIGLFNWGPSTGNPVFYDRYADEIWDLLRAGCSSGRITGLMAVRETRRYPVLSGEIVKISGYCIR